MAPKRRALSCKWRVLLQALLGIFGDRHIGVAKGWPARTAVFALMPTVAQKEVEKSKAKSGDAAQPQTHAW